MVNKFGGLKYDVNTRDYLTETKNEIVKSIYIYVCFHVCEVKHRPDHGTRS